MATSARQVGLVGVGEVGSVVVRELLSVDRWPVCFDSRPEEITDSAARELGIELYKSIGDFAAAVDVVIVTVVGRESLHVAHEVVPALRSGTLYADWTTTSPAVRDAIAAVCAECDVRFADVSILDTVTWIDRSIELLVSGPGASGLSAVLDGTRLIPRVIDDERPVSTEVKLLRSVFTKGLEALLLETLGAAQALGIRPEVERSVLRFMSEDFDRIIDLLVGSSMRHAERRANEVHDVLELLLERVGGAPMTSGAARLLDGLVVLNETHVGAPTDDATEVLARVVDGRLLGLLSDRATAP